MQDALILAVIFLLLWGGHWMPWRICLPLIDRNGELHRCLAYIYGCGCILIGFALWILMQPALLSGRSAFLFLAADMIAAGLGTLAPRLVRWIVVARAAQRDLATYEQTITDR